VVEASRKHGPFDRRWPCIRTERSGELSTAPFLSAAEVAEELDWQTFSARNFPERGRHDSEARSAYAAYGQRREQRQRPKLTLVPTETSSAAMELAPEKAETVAVRRAGADH